MSELSALTITEAASRCQRGEATPSDVLHSALDRYETLKFDYIMDAGFDPKALSRDVADNETLRQDAAVRLRLPCTAVVSCDVDLAGHSSTGGLPLLSIGRATADAATISCLRRSGARILGHATESPLNTGWIGARSTAGTVKNVRNLAGAAIASSRDHYCGHNTAIKTPYRWLPPSCHVHMYLIPHLMHAALGHPGRGGRRSGGRGSSCCF